jgi:hypothetical protein
MSSIDWAALLRDDQIKKQTVPVLKAFCDSKGMFWPLVSFRVSAYRAATGLEKSGKKADLVDRVAEFLALQ